MQILVRSVLGLLAAFGVLIFASVRKDDGMLYVLFIPGFVFLAICVVRPVSVVVDNNGIRQRRWFLHDKEIRWGDVESVLYGRNTGTIYVLSKKGGPKIRFSNFLIGSARFKHEIRSHARNANIYWEEGEDYPRVK